MLMPSPSEETQLDALGDIGIYLLDYCNRENLNLADYFPRPSEVAMNKLAIQTLITPYGLGRVVEDSGNITLTRSLVNLSASLGALAHCILKRHQDIRGFDDIEKFKTHQTAAIESITRACVWLSLCLNQDWLLIIGATWEDVVSKRNWKTSPTGPTVDTNTEPAYPAHVD
jgi:hypothetical protein